MMSSQKPQNIQGLVRHLAPTEVEIDEEFERLEREEKQLPVSRMLRQPCYRSSPKSWTRAMPLTNNRVQLGNTSFDYISAWPIDFGSLKHIASQHLTSIYDLWRMTEDENFTSIIMLMPVNCNGEDPCARYYPRDISGIIQIGITSSRS